MAKCNFSIGFFVPPEELINKVRSAIEGQGGSFTGDLSFGTFSVNVLGRIEGSYAISGQQMDVKIDSKPILISCSQIETFMKNQLSGA